jgi:hypothetical protein
MKRSFVGPGVRNLRDPRWFIRWAAGRSGMGKGLASSDVNHPGIEGPVKVPEKLQPAQFKHPVRLAECLLA